MLAGCYRRMSAFRIAMRGCVMRKPAARKRATATSIGVPAAEASEASAVFVSGVSIMVNGLKESGATVPTQIGNLRIRGN